MRRSFTVVALTVATLLLATPASAASPIDFDNRPNGLAGYTNGELPASLLVNVTPTCRAERNAAPSLHLLFQVAGGFGVNLGAEECYRSLDDQIAARANATANGNPACAASVPIGANGRPVGRSMHGWGRAADMVDQAGSLDFTSLGYSYLKVYAWRVGWNHAGWAEPGGSTCPEPWHWEWVGDGGNLGLDPIRADVVAMVRGPADAGYGLVTGLGGIGVHGSLAHHGAVDDIPINWLVVGGAATPSGNGYYMTAIDGGVFTFGDAAFRGSMGAVPLNQPVVGMTTRPTGTGYWLVAADGGVFSFGDAAFRGSMGGVPLNKAVVGMAATSSGNGYWMVASDGGVFSFGDAGFFGSLGALRLNQPIVGMARTSSGNGYWLVAADGGVFTFGDARFLGAPTDWSTSPTVAIAATSSGNGYWVTTAAGEVFGFGDAGWFGNG